MALCGWEVSASCVGAPRRPEIVGRQVNGGPLGATGVRAGSAQGAPRVRRVAMAPALEGIEIKHEVVVEVRVWEIDQHFTHLYSVGMLLTARG